jgi:3D (Asp-Asp-Asp) domain-containing protein
MKLIIVALISLFLAGCTEMAGNSIMTFPILEKSGVFTAYNAEAAQTDNTPLVTASGQKVNKGIIANNCLPFGTKIEVNNEIFEVQDRMHARYGCDYFDIFMWDYHEARQFGKQELNYKIVMASYSS